MPQGKVCGFVPMGDSNPDTEATASYNAVGFVHFVVFASWQIEHVGGCYCIIYLKISCIYIYTYNVMYGLCLL